MEYVLKIETPKQKQLFAKAMTDLEGFFFKRTNEFYQSVKRAVKQSRPTADRPLLLVSRTKREFEILNDIENHYLKKYVIEKEADHRSDQQLKQDSAY